MLRRQQVEAVIAARKRIVEGAVSMVDMVVKQFAEGNVLELDDKHKAVMASNLMVVLVQRVRGTSYRQYKFTLLIHCGHPLPR